MPTSTITAPATEQLSLFVLKCESCKQRLATHFMIYPDTVFEVCSSCLVDGS